MSEELDEQFGAVGGVLDDERLREDLARGLETITDGGYPYATIAATDFALDDGVRYRVRVDAGARTRIDSLIVRGAALTRPRDRRAPRGLPDPAGCTANASSTAFAIASPAPISSPGCRR